MVLVCFKIVKSKRMKKMKALLLTAMMVLSVSLIAQKQSFYDFKVKTLEGETFDFST